MGDRNGDFRYRVPGVGWALRVWSFCGVFRVKEAGEFSYDDRGDPNERWDRTNRGSCNWKEIAADVEDATLQVGNEFREEYLVIVTEPRSDFADDFTLADFTEIVCSQMAESLGGTASAATPVQIDAGLAMEVEIKATVDGLKVVYLNSCIQTDTHFHQVLGWTLPSKERTAFPIFREIVQSFEQVGP